VTNVDERLHENLLTNRSSIKAFEKEKVMSNRKHLLVGSVVAIWALLSLVGKTRHEAKQQQKKLQKVELNTWEGEGGNLPPLATSGAAAASSTPDA
jgi:hypothetical protein